MTHRILGSACRTRARQRAPTAAALARLAVSVIAGALTPESSAAQSAPAAQAGPANAALAGVVRDSAGRPVPFVLVSADSTGRTAYTDSAGDFRLGGLPAGLGRFSVRRIGYLPSDFDVDLPADATVHLAITMLVVARRLETVIVNGERRDAALAGVGFYDRAAGERPAFGSGRYITPEELAPWRQSWLTVALRQVPDVRFDGPPGRVRAQFRDVHAQLGCSPGVWIDGQLSPTPFEALDGLLPVSRVRAVEVYPWPRSVPPRFRVARAPTTCGAVVIWTDWLDGR